MLIKVLSREDDFKSNGTFRVGYLDDVDYNDLVKILGEPIFITPVGEDKIQREWLVEYDGEIFTLYDWKYYNTDVTTAGKITWNIGGKTNPMYFIEYIERSING